MTSPHRYYRSDIDGLRAIAVLAVVAYHAFPEGIRGGFAGVDVFFVISGYLISRILFEDIDKGRFRYSTFYKRRTKRLLPALIVVLFSCLCIGWFTLFLEEYTSLARDVVHGALFLSNFLLWQQAGYFDSAAINKPLLHLWSLAIEEQFYLIWPIVLGLCVRFRDGIPKVTISIALASFLANLAYLYAGSAGAYYSPLSRFWELMLGCYLAHRSLKGTSEPSEIKSYLGLSLIALGFILIHPDRAFPGWWALFPTVGTCLVISAGGSASLNRLLLSSPILVGIGLISYPLYLWHWPLLSFAHILEGGEPSWQVRLGIVFLSITLSWLTYRWVEQPLRKSRNERLWVSVLVVGITTITLTAFFILHSNTLGFRFLNRRAGAKLHTGYAGEDGGNLVFGCGAKDSEIEKHFGTCLKDKRGEATVGLLGDSKADALRPGLVRHSTPETRILILAGHGKLSPPVPAISESPVHRPYQKSIRTAVTILKDNPKLKVIIIAGSTRALFGLKNDRDIEDLPTNPNAEVVFEGLDNVVGTFIRSGKKVILLVDNPTLPEPNACLPRTTGFPMVDRLFRTEERARCSIPYERQIQLSQKYRDVLKRIATKYPGNTELFDPTDLLCDRQKGVCSSARDGHILYSYTDHISDYSSGLIGEELIALTKAMIDPPEEK